MIKNCSLAKGIILKTNRYGIAARQIKQFAPANFQLLLILKDLKFIEKYFGG